jgi:lysozyme
VDRFLIAQLVEKHEGRKAAVYTDSKGNLTIGVGFNLDACDAKATCEAHGLDYYGLYSGQVTLSDAEIDELLDSTLNAAIYGAQCQVPNFDMLPDKAQAAVVDMVFNLGATGFSEFVKMRERLDEEDFAGAAEELKASLWCGQVKTRCDDNAKLMAEAGGE